MPDVALVDAYRDNPLFGTKVDGAYQWVTYRQVGEMVDAFRGGLVSLGVGKGDKVAVISNNRVEWAVAAYATYGLGAQYVPMYEAQLAKEWHYILEDCGAKVLLAANQDIYDRTKGFVDELDTLDQAEMLEAFHDFCAGLVGDGAPATPLAITRSELEGRAKLTALSERGFVVSGAALAITAHEVDDDGGAGQDEDGAGGAKVTCSKHRVPFGTCVCIYAGKPPGK